MKTKLLHKSLMMVVVATGLLLTTGCNTVSIDSKQYLGLPNYAPTNPAEVQVLRKEPAEPHVQLGEIRAEPSSDDVSAQKIETALKNAAAKLGANAVVIVYDRTQVTGAMVSGPWYGRSVQQIEGRVIIGVAIRFTGNSP
jgi:hypothetical protein